MKKQLPTFIILLGLMVFITSMIDKSYYKGRTRLACNLNIAVKNSSTSTAIFSATGATNFGPTTLGSGGITNWSGSVPSSPQSYALSARVSTTVHSAGRFRLRDNLGNVVACVNVPANYTSPLIFTDVDLKCNIDYVFEYREGVSCPN